MRAIRRAAMRILRCLPLLVLFFALPAFADGPHRLALQISDNDLDKMNAVLNVAANVSKYYSDKGEEVEVQIVAFNAGLHMLREDTSPVKPRLSSFKSGMPNVDSAERVPAGVVTLIELGEKGWTIVRP